MPYIEQIKASKLGLDDVVSEMLYSPDNAGELNAALSSVLAAYILKHGLRYQFMNDCLGALEGAKLEFTRRVVDSYEQIKLQEEGRYDPYSDIPIA